MYSVFGVINELVLMVFYDTKGKENKPSCYYQNHTVPTP